MKIVLISALALLLLSSQPLYARHVNSSSEVVHGYTKKNGKHVNSYHRTVANGTKRDNYSAKGNINPWTGKAGTH